MRLAGGLMGRVGDETAAVFAVWGEHAMVSGEMGAGARHRASSLRERHFRGGEAGNELYRVEHDMGRPVMEGVLESIHDLPAVIDREAFVRDGWAGDVAAKAFEGVPLMGSAARAGPQLHHSGGYGGRIPKAERCRGCPPAGWTRRCAGSGPCARCGGRWRCGSGRRRRGVARNRRRVRCRGRGCRRHGATILVSRGRGRRGRRWCGAGAGVRPVPGCKRGRSSSNV